MVQGRFANADLEQIMSMIEVTASGEGMTLPRMPRSIGLWDQAARTPAADVGLGR